MSQPDLWIASPVKILAPKWELTLGMPATPDGIKPLAFHLPTAPNAFHRFMQRLVLGFKWTRI